MNLSKTIIQEVPDLPHQFMKLPKTITIGCTKIKIVIKDGFEDYGQFDSEKMIISLRKSDFDPMFETLRHEITHASLFIGGISFMEKYDEEVVVRCLENLFWPCWNKLTKNMK